MFGISLLMQGRLVEHPTAELIREIAATELSGTLRLARSRAKAAIYFEDGQLTFASSNLRAHRLQEILSRRGVTKVQVDAALIKAPDGELARALIQSGQLTAETLATIRADQVSDVVRLALLWTDGTFEFDPRARPIDESRVQIDLNRLLLECGRRLPAGLATFRLARTTGSYLAVADNSEVTHFLPAEAFVLTRASEMVTLSELTALSGLGEEEGLRTIYALSLSGHLQRSDWPSAFGSERLGAARKGAQTSSPSRKTIAGAEGEAVDGGNVDALFARLEAAKDHYEVLDIGRTSSVDEMKSAYHALARRFHPDRFHRNEPTLRYRIDSAFARIARAYETLSDPSLRANYDAGRTSKSRTAPTQEASAKARDANGGRVSRSGSKAGRAETSFQRGLEAMQNNRHDEGTRLLAEAAMLQPGEARYRAQYGYALIKQSNTRRAAEGELQAALQLDPDNSSYRVMLAELYKELGLRRRAEGELERALAANPKNEAARSLLLSLKGK